MLIDFIKLSPNQLKNPGEQRASLSQYGHRNSWELELSNQWCPSLNQSLQLGWDALCARRVELQVGRGCPLREKPGLLSAGGRVPRGRERRPIPVSFASGAGEPAEEAQALTDISEEETDSLRPGEEDGDAATEEGHEDGGEEFQYDNLDQGEPLWGSEEGGREARAAHTQGRAGGLSTLGQGCPWAGPEGLGDGL